MNGNSNILGDVKRHEVKKGTPLNNQDFIDLNRALLESQGLNKKQAKEIFRMQKEIDAIKESRDSSERCTDKYLEERDEYCHDCKELFYWCIALGLTCVGLLIFNLMK